MTWRKSSRVFPSLAMFLLAFSLVEFNFEQLVLTYHTCSGPFVSALSLGHLRRPFQHSHTDLLAPHLITVSLSIVVALKNERCVASAEDSTHLVSPVRWAVCMLNQWRVAARLLLNNPALPDWHILHFTCLSYWNNYSGKASFPEHS